MAIASNRNWADALAGLGWCNFWIGSFEEAVLVHEEAICLSPRDPLMGYWYFRIAVINLLRSQTDKAILCFERARVTISTFPRSILSSVAPMHSMASPNAGPMLTYRLSGNAWVSTIADMKVTRYWGPPKLRALYESIYFAGLRKLGVPEE
jgi:tetratricopeptide (TPR) repeat protein